MMMKKEATVATLLTWPFAVEYRRTNEWYEVHWPIMSRWCTTTFGYGNWEYYAPDFRFKTEADKIMFILRWI